MKLYELEKGDSFTLAGEDDSPVFTFDHVDGMYSVCWLAGSIVHLGASAPVLKVEDRHE